MATIEIHDGVYNRFVDYCQFNGTDVSETLNWLMDEAKLNIDARMSE